MKNVITVAILLSGVALFSLGDSAREVAVEQIFFRPFKSAESLTAEGKPVYNQVAIFKFADKHVYMMNQSHHGPISKNEPIGESGLREKSAARAHSKSTEAFELDRIAIVVNTLKKPMTAEYYQLPPGDLVWSNELKAQTIKPKAACLRCHSNGPRAIRPDTENPENNITLKDKWNIFKANLTIKHYGRIIPEPNQFAVIGAKKDSISKHKESAGGEHPLALNSKGQQDKLEISICKMCHKESGFLARGDLTRQNSGSIEFLVKNKMMPPLGIPLSDQDYDKIMFFVNGGN